MKTSWYAEQYSIVQRREILIRTLRQGLKLSDEEMAKAGQLAELAMKSGAPDRFLAAVVALVHKPIFLPCDCLWCRLKRWTKKVAVGRKTQ